MKTIERDKVKKYMNRKILLGASSLAICIGVIAICSFVPFMIDPSRWQTTEFLTDELIISAITIFSMIATMYIGQASNAQSEKSNIAKSRAKFFDTVTKITNINAFNQWVRRVLQPNDIQTIKERKMRSIGIEDFSVLDLERGELRQLVETPQKFNGRYYKSLSKEQVDTLLKIKEGKIKLSLVEPSYYLSVKNLIDNRTISERSSKEGLKKGLTLTKSLVSKLLLTVITAMIFASLMRDLTASSDTAKALMKFISRLWAMISSAFMGYIVGAQINDIDSEYIEMRVTVQNMFLQDTEFTPVDLQEEAKQEFIDRVEKEQVLKLDNKSNEIEMKG